MVLGEVDQLPALFFFFLLFYTGTFSRLARRRLIGMCVCVCYVGSCIENPFACQNFLFRTPSFLPPPPFYGISESRQRKRWTGAKRERKRLQKCGVQNNWLACVGYWRKFSKGRSAGFSFFPPEKSLFS